VSSAAASASPSVRVLGDAIPGERVRDVLLTVGYALAIAASGQLAFFLPGNPVPITAQTFVVLAGAIVLGTSRATVGAAGYLALGVAGVPWFAASSGATVGYIIGFVVAGVLLGAIAQRGYLRGPVQVASAMVVGNLVIYAFGVAWIATALRLQPEFLAAFELQGLPGFGTLLAMFVVPFLIGDAIKIAAATAVVPSAWKLVDRSES
jgi:biotin transport system substrate-specific component